MFSCLPEELETNRKFSTTICGSYIKTRKAALYWTIHSKKHIAVYLQFDDAPEIIAAIRSKLPSSIELRQRPYPRKGIAIMTPSYFFVETEEQAQNMGPLLQLLSSSEFQDATSVRKSSSHYWTPDSEKNDPEFQAMEEGNRVTVTISKYERDHKNRKKCIEHYGTICSACGFDFSVTYGEIGTGYIHVHHLTPLASLNGKATKIDPIRDLRPVCPNCHEMLHRINPPYTIEQLKDILVKARM